MWQQLESFSVQETFKEKMSAELQHLLRSPTVTDQIYSALLGGKIYEYKSHPWLNPSLLLSILHLFFVLFLPLAPPFLLAAVIEFVVVIVLLFLLHGLFLVVLLLLLLLKVWTVT